jgi:hypothetical protein
MELLRKRDNPQYKVGTFENHPTNAAHHCFFLFAKLLCKHAEEKEECNPFILL